MNGKRAKQLRKIANNFTDNPVTEYDDKLVASSKYRGFNTKVARLKKGCARRTYKDLKKLYFMAARRQGYASTGLGREAGKENIYREEAEREDN